MSDHVCDTGDFDRTICPEPCGYMHSYCSACGERQDRCAHDAGRKPTAEVLAELTGDDRTVTEAATHQRITVEPCACGSDVDHLEGEQ